MHVKCVDTYLLCNFSLGDSASLLSERGSRGGLLTEPSSRIRCLTLETLKLGLAEGGGGGVGLHRMCRVGQVHTTGQRRKW